MPENAASLVGREFVHFKGGHYRLRGFAKASETLETMVVYEALYEDSPSLTSYGGTGGGLWVRPAKMFFENVTRNGKIVNVGVDESCLTSGGEVDVAKLDPITLDPVNHVYLKLGAKAGDAFKAGLAMKCGECVKMCAETL